MTITGFLVFLKSARKMVERMRDRFASRNVNLIFIINQSHYILVRIVYFSRRNIANDTGLLIINFKQVLISKKAKQFQGWYANVRYVGYNFIRQFKLPSSSHGFGMANG